MQNLLFENLSPSPEDDREALKRRERESLILIPERTIGDHLNSSEDL